MYFLVLLSMSFIPLVLFIFIYVNKKLRMSKPLAIFLLLLFLWNVDVVVLFGQNIFDEQMILRLFQIFRIGSIMLMPLMYYFNLSIKKNLDERQFKLKFLINQKLFMIFLLYSFAVYIINFTEYGVGGLQLIKGTAFFPEYYYPIYGRLNILYYINVIIGFINTFLLLYLSTKLKTNYYRTLCIYIVLSSLLVFINGALTGFNILPLPISILNAVFVTIVIFSAYFYIQNQMIQKMNNELLDQKNFLQTIIDANPNYIYVKDIYGNYIIVNKSYALDFGSKIDAPIINYLTQRNMDMKKMKTYEKCVKDRQGMDRYFEVTEIPFFTSKEEQYILYIENDITQRLKEEEFIRKSEKLSVVGELAAGVAHEIRNPLTSLKGFIQLVKSDDNDLDKKNFYLDIMSNELDRINEVINELLLLSKPQADVLKKIDILKILKDVKILLDTTAVVQNINIHIQSETDIPTIEGAGNQIKQVLINIVKNAVEALPNGGQIDISVKRLREPKIKIEVADNGVGIPEERIKKMGEPFYTTKEKGTGLGLTVCARIIKRHNGELYFESELGKGTKVHIILPIQQQRT
ncbi:ATP-binding protein [Bacillus alveayuensis]|uniref:ATP-binding protein n=1 Tax=Aeribacillus alveayuensis TaxID=279215 RepID=UPI000696F7F8|nr:ATP-binding protein [Bacillus alveayuensis]